MALISFLLMGLIACLGIRVASRRIFRRLQADFEARTLSALQAASRQIAHDIRSPLTAIAMVEKDLRQVPEEKRQLLQSAMNRIRDIANNLVDVHPSNHSAPPLWFVETLRLNKSIPIVVFDDDASIHQVWRQRFHTCKEFDLHTPVFYFSTPQELRQWVRQNPGDATYLLDYKILGFKETGLDLARELNLHSRTILVTSQFDDQKLHQRCVEIGIKILPKGLAAFVPIEFI